MHSFFAVERESAYHPIIEIYADQLALQSQFLSITNDFQY